TTPPPTPVPPSTTLEPTGPPRLLLVDGDVPCSGFVELHKEGLWGAVASSPSLWPRVATENCRALGPSVLSCFGRTGSQRGKPPAFITCEGSRALRRLGGGATPCEGEPEVFHRGRWQGLCDSREQRARRGQQLCRELQCGNLSSSTKSQAPPALGVACRAPSLHLCPGPLDPLQMCSRTRVVCQDSKPQPVGTPAGTIVSICLALLLLGVLLLICGPPAYRRLVKRSRWKEGEDPHPRSCLPSSLPVSFHRNSTVSRRPRAEGQRGQGGDNDYAQPPQRSSCLSAYPALEGACRASNPADNSSDSDYDLSSARRV
ncbi:T-cell surface glycoprotein CD5, partial [Dryobates pubescens]